MILFLCHRNGIILYSWHVHTASLVPRPQPQFMLSSTSRPLLSQHKDKSLLHNLTWTRFTIDHKYTEREIILVGKAPLTAASYVPYRMGIMHTSFHVQACTILIVSTVSIITQS